MPISKNPIKELRETAHLTMDALAERADVSKQLIIRTEQGCFTDPPPKLLNYLTYLVPDADIPEVLIRYRNFQRETRKANYGLLPTSTIAHYNSVNPITALREHHGLTMSEVTKGFCIHPTIMHKLERQPHLCQSIPSAFYDALQESGYSVEWLASLILRYQEYKKFLRGKVSSRSVPYTLGYFVGVGDK